MPSLTGGDESIGVRVSTSADTKGIDQTTRSVKGLDDSAASGGVSFLKLTGAVAAGQAVFAAAKKAIDLSGWAVSNAADVEVLRTNFDTMLGSVDKGRNLFSQLQNMANITPFVTSDLAQGAQLLLAYGTAQEKILPTLNMIGDVSLGNKEKFDRLTLAYGQITSKGRLMGQELLQLTEAGFNPLQKMSERTGESMVSLSKKMENGQISSEMVADEFKRATAEGGQFFEGMKKGSATLPGLFSTLKDNVAIATRSIVGLSKSGDVIEGGLYDKLKDLATKAIPAVSSAADKAGPAMITFMDNLGRIAGEAKVLAEKVGDYLAPKFIALYNTINDRLMPVLVNLWHNVIEPLLPVIGTALVIAVGASVDILNAMITSVSWVVKAMQDGNPFVWALVAAFTALAGAMAFNAAFNAITVGFNVMRLITIPQAMASLSAFKAMVAAPGIMPALVITAALASLAEVKRAVDAIRGAIDAVNDSAKAAANLAPQEQMRALQKQAAAARAAGDTAAVNRYANAIAALGGGRAKGGPVSAGTAYLVGENADGSPNATTELFVPSQSGTIIPAKQTQQILGGGSGMGVTMNNTYIINSQIDFDAALREQGWRLATVG